MVDDRSRAGHGTYAYYDGIAIVLGTPEIMVNYSRSGLGRDPILEVNGNNTHLDLLA